MTINLHQIVSFIPHFLKAKRRGHGVHSPFAYQLCEEVFYNEDEFYDFERLKLVRNRLLEDKQKLEIKDLGAGSKTFKTKHRKIKDIADRGVTLTAHSELFFKLINFLKCSRSIELGTSIGLNTLYLAQANAKGKVYSIEGSSALSAFATGLATEQKISNIHFFNENFDEALPNLLKDIGGFDLLYVDGNHTYEATLRYFTTALENVQPSAVIIFDDIYWSKGMTRAWQEIKAHPAVTLSIDAFYFGMVFFRNEFKEKTELRLYI